MVKCKTHYDPKKGYVRDNGDKISVFRFPAEKTEPENRNKWIEVCSKVRLDLKVNKETVICERHWPPNYPTYRKKGAVRPAVPPSIWPGVPESVIPEPPPPPRVTVRTSNQARNTLPDEFDDFERLDCLSFADLENELVAGDLRELPAASNSFSDNGYIC